MIDEDVCRLVRELGQRMDLPGLALDSEGLCGLQFDGRYDIGLRYDAGTYELWFFADLGAPVSGESSYVHLLRGNLFWHATSGATLSLTQDEPPNVVAAVAVKWRHHDAASLAAQLESFVDTVESWSRTVASLPDAATSSVAVLDQALSPLRG